MKSATVGDPGAASKDLISRARELKSHSEAPILDAGCGYGRNAVALACHGISVVCVDQWKERLDFGGHGKNYLDLPKAGQLQGLLSKDFHLPFYRERKVGPADYDAVAVKLFAQKRSPLPTPGSTDGP